MNNTALLLTGFLNNFLIAFVAFIHPMLAGMTVLLIKHGKKVKRPCFAWSIAECVPPIALMFAIYYLGPRLGIHGRYETTGLLITMMVLSISHTGYIPLRIRDRYTARNYFVCAIDLFCSLLKWSTAAGFIMSREIIRSAQMISSRTFSSGSFIAAFAILFGVLLLLQFIKWLIARGGKESFEE